VAAIHGRSAAHPQSYYDEAAHRWVPRGAHRVYVGASSGTAALQGTVHIG
jgi:hypothetical protein